MRRIDLGGLEINENFLKISLRYVSVYAETGNIGKNVPFVFLSSKVWRGAFSTQQNEIKITLAAPARCIADVGAHQ